VASPQWVSTDDGVKLAAYDFGGDGPPLLLLHATGFHAHLWLPVIDRLRDRFHCYAFDERGHGASPSPANGDFGWEVMGEDARQVAEQLGLRRPAAVGHSGGGAHLILAEEGHPGSWSALWTFEPVIRAVPVPMPELPANPMAAGARRRRDRFPSRDAAYENFSGKPPFSAFAPDALRLYVDYGFVDTEDGDVELACRRDDEAAMYENALTDAFDRLTLVRIPVHVACGGDSNHFAPEGMEAVADRLPNGTLEVMDGIGHFGPFEDPARVAASIRTALG
jgi:pimeloyl-ACP methyl ester carboxylesterase